MILNRIKKIITDSIGNLSLNLEGLNVLTEVGSGFFIFTPVIAKMAKAEKIFVVVNDTAYGKGEDIINELKEILKTWNIDDSNFFFSINSVPEHFLQEADIVTNSGHLRPLNESKLKHTKNTCVIPVMYEKWELRPSDIDVDYCQQKGIKVAGTWENHPSVKIFDYCKHLMLKLIFDAGFEVKGNKIIIFGDDHYGTLLEKACRDLEAEKVILTRDKDVVVENVSDADFIFFADYNNKQKLLTDSESLFDVKAIKELNDSVSIIHLAGEIDDEFVKENGINIFPDKKGYPQRMTETLAYLGPLPILMLQTAGLRVGECLLKNDLSNELVQLL
ncbi:hypothetical protein [Chryseobacterium sp. MEBOG07]|uniref:hypothetical protein n=1 Tax=Chryseobacterium sp. MEBOG07 TaxID=2879939 RepID=UPI001F4012A8|nr:hypothetical protein [Chryseobacterium sp. MEBOG07]UKB80672.1 hypothetical protein LF886_06680 [Chryseobacterium sp. MEBOG07]